MVILYSDVNHFIINFYFYFFPSLLGHPEKQQILLCCGYFSVTFYGNIGYMQLHPSQLYTCYCVFLVSSQRELYSTLVLISLCPFLDISILCIFCCFLQFNLLSLQLLAIVCYYKLYSQLVSYLYGFRCTYVGVLYIVVMFHLLYCVSTSRIALQNVRGQVIH